MIQQLSSGILDMVRTVILSYLLIILVTRILSIWALWQLNANILMGDYSFVLGKTMATLTHHKKSVRAMALHPKEYGAFYMFLSVSCRIYLIIFLLN